MFPLLVAMLSLAAGDVAPPLNKLDLVRGPTKYERQQISARTLLLNQPTLVEFWATWCGPCVEQIPRWNALEEKYRGRIQFIAITADDPETVEAFLNKRPMEGWVLLDSDGAVHQAYGVASLPYTFLVDSHGTVRGVTTLSRLREADIESLAAGRAFEPPPPPGSG